MFWGMATSGAVAARVKATTGSNFYNLHGAAGWTRRLGL